MVEDHLPSRLFDHIDDDRRAFRMFLYRVFNRGWRRNMFRDCGRREGDSLGERDDRLDSRHRHLQVQRSEPDSSESRSQYDAGCSAPGSALGPKKNEYVHRESFAFKECLELTASARVLFRQKIS